MSGSSQAAANAAAETALTLVHQGWTHLELQRPLAAWASWQAALRAAPDFPAAVEALEMLASSPDLPVSARASYRFRPPDDEARRSRWNATLQGNDLADLAAATQAFESLCDADPEDAPAHFNLALCRAWLGHNEDALDNLEHAGALWAADAFDLAVETFSLAEIIRQGAGAEHRADDLRFTWVLDRDDDVDAALRTAAPLLRQLSVPVDPASESSPSAAVRLFEWFDRPFPESSTTSLTAADLPRVLATLVLTPTSLRLSSPLYETLERVREPLLRGEIDRRVSPLALTLLDANVWTFRLPRGLDADTRAALTREALEDFYENTWIHLPRQGLGDLTPLEASLERGAAIRARLSAVVRIREQLGRVLGAAGLYLGYPFDRLRSRLGLDLEDPATVDPDDPTCMNAAGLDRIDPKALDPQRLVEALASARGLRDEPLETRFTEERTRRRSVALEKDPT